MMKIKRATDSSYAYIEWSEDDQRKAAELEAKGGFFAASAERSLPKGLRVEVSPADRIPERVRRNLEEGLYVVVK
jgi:hypothetical protein